MLIDDGTGGLSKDVIGVAIEIHRKYGAALLEDAYLRPMVWALEKRGFEIETEVPLAIEFEGQVVQRAYIIDVVVTRGEYRLLLEIKSVAVILPIHFSQVTTYLSLSGIPVGLLMNFNVQVMRHGIKRVFHPNLRRHMRQMVPRQTHGVDQQAAETDSSEGIVKLVSTNNPFNPFE